MGVCVCVSVCMGVCTMSAKMKVEHIARTIEYHIGSTTKLRFILTEPFGRQMPSSQAFKGADTVTLVFVIHQMYAMFGFVCVCVHGRVWISQ